MCDACNLRINSGVTSVVTKCQRVLAKKFPFMIHHFIMFLTFPIAFVSIYAYVICTYVCRAINAFPN